ncbi:MAG: hypothetical protein COT91_04100 [Candidatus Doudnabacteria bacterium CG10_big_fil_rev_8_21_14_0_10_41_10]|uniref:Transcriptional repressor n=1 Tax=Candidatus Doudnabacteria bacterium CG10_big_fil_rev_8_21_14_0_10_41_10 TaxID=1974551 RepID=A0A2H0VCU9_9BACT|nr:MAG: hypothetical protein COT91_04100 [Candidatus Doudnabacteria bacterium CG10_big_fil_rev_8_21_14_0_10_41_10]
MAKFEEIIKRQKKAGFRSTKKRRALIKVLVAATAPLTENELRGKLKLLKLSPNKTTVYRQMKKLLRLNIIQEVDFGDRKKRYELATNHHHHLVCNNCHKIQDVKFENELKQQEKLIERNKKFHVTTHTLEFFGLCAKCKN